MSIHKTVIFAVVLAAALSSACGSKRFQSEAPFAATIGKTSEESVLARWTLPAPDVNGVIDYAGTTSAPAPADVAPAFSIDDVRQFLTTSPNPVVGNGDPELTLRLVGAKQNLTWVATYHHTPVVISGPRTLTQQQRDYIASGDCDSIYLIDANTGAPGDTLQICTVPKTTLDLIVAGKYKGEPAWSVTPA